MKKISADLLEFEELNRIVRESDADTEITGCLGQRFIATGLANKRIIIQGTPGNALGAYLNGAEITVHGNAQDAVGDTMNAGIIAIHGNIGDAAGYAMRGGRIYVRGNAGYRAGIHMKEYGEKKPVIMIGGSCGSFLGEYQAGGIIIVLGLNNQGKIVGEYPCTGMHGGKMFLRSDCRNIRFPGNVTVRVADTNDMNEIKGHIFEFCEMFDLKKDEILNHTFTLVIPDTKNPYKQMYVAN
jgi:glutamate synthase domain-containing protein 3